MKRLFTSTLFALSALLLVASGQAYADQTGTLLPTSDGNYLQWTPKTGSSHFSMVDETTCNGTTDYNDETTVGQRDSYGIPISSIPDGATITQIDITPCASRNSTGSGTSVLDVFYRLNGVDSSDAGAYTFTSGTTPSVQSTTSFTGLSTVKSPTTTFEIGGVYSSGTKGLRLSQIATKVTYTPLATPSGLTAVTTGTNVALHWIDNSSNEDGFKIERSDNGGSFVEIATVSANVTTYNDPGLAEGTYAYRVRAYNSGGNTTYTATATTYVLNAPSGLTATATGSTIALSWTDNSSLEDGFKIEIATGAGSFVQVATVAANITTKSFTNVPANNYTYRVRAYKSTTNSDYSNTDGAVVLVAPSGLYLTVSNVDITVHWLDNSSNEDGFKIERSIDGGAFSQIDTVVANTTTYLDPGLSGAMYTYRVRAYNNGGDNSNYSNASTVTIVPAPSNLTAVATGSAVTLNWIDNANNETGFRIEVATGAGSFVQIATVSANTTTYQNLPLSPNTYSYRVRAYKIPLITNSDYSNTANTIVLAAPTGLGTSVVGSDVTLNWTDNATGEDGYKIERSDNGGGYVEIGSVGADVTTFSDPGLASGSYDYRVRAYQSTNTSDYSNSANALIP